MGIADKQNCCSLDLLECLRECSQIETLRLEATRLALPGSPCNTDLYPNRQQYWDRGNADMTKHLWIIRPYICSHLPLGVCALLTTSPEILHKWEILSPGLVCSLGSGVKERMKSRLTLENPAVSVSPFCKHLVLDCTRLWHAGEWASSLWSEC